MPVVRACYTERVPRISPFRGLVYDPSVAGPWEQLTAPPYDVISESDQEGLRARSPYNIVHIDLTGGAVGDGAVPGYATAASLLADWSASGVLTAPDAPRYYGYELRYRVRGITRLLRGLVGALELEPWGGTVLPHEQTMPGPIEDRLRRQRLQGVKRRVGHESVTASQAIPGSGDSFSR